jgi:hypothetical protein
LLNRFQIYTSRDLRIYFVRSLIIPIFLFTDAVYFSLLTGSLGGLSWLLMRVQEMCLVFELRRFDHISEFSRSIICYILFEYLELRLACFINKIGLVAIRRCLSKFSFCAW